MRGAPHKPSGNLVWPALLRDWQIVSRCIHQRGPMQERCLREMSRRGLGLSASQRTEAGLAGRGRLQ